MLLLVNTPLIRERFYDSFGIEQKSVWLSQYGGGAKENLPAVRILKWKCSWDIIKENWIFGVGTGDAQDVLQKKYQDIHFTVAFEEEYNSHNQFLQTWLGLGILGLFLFLASLFFPLMMAYRQHIYLFIVFITLFSICCFTESFLCRQHGIVFYAFFNSLFAFNSLKFANKDEA